MGFVYLFILRKGQCIAMNRRKGGVTDCSRYQDEDWGEDREVKIDEGGVWRELSVYKEKCDR